jgi:hypothetical protein
VLQQLLLVHYPLLVSPSVTTTNIYSVKINKDRQIRIRKDYIYAELTLAKELATVSCIWQRFKGKAEECGSLRVDNKEGFRH